MFIPEKIGYPKKKISFEDYDLEEVSEDFVFGNASFNDGTGFLANTVRFMHAGHSDPAVTGDISTGLFSTKGNKTIPSKANIGNLKKSHINI